MTRYRVAVLTSLVGRDGGIATHVLESASALGAAGHHVTLVCAHAEAGDWPAPVIALPELQNLRFENSDRPLEEALQSCTPDVVHIHDLAAPRVVAAAKRVAPTVVSAHAYPGCTHNNHYFAPGVECDRAHGLGCLAHIAFRGCSHARNPMPIPRQYRDTTARLAAYAGADAIIGYSSPVIRHLERNGLHGNLVPLFTSMKHQDGPAVAQRHPGGRHVLFVGRLAPQKGLDTLLRAMPLIEGALTVVGDGWQRSAMEGLAARLGVAARVHFVGWMVGEELAEAYRRSTVVSMPSSWPEPFGLVGIEAMAFGKPVVASMTGGIVDWLQPEVTGLGVRPGQPSELAAGLSRILDDDSLQRSMGLAARQSVEQRFSERAHVRALESVYAGVSVKGAG